MDTKQKTKKITLLSQLQELQSKKLNDVISWI
jgi:hypothetical protein